MSDFIDLDDAVEPAKATETTPAEEQTPEGDKKFTQEDLDRIVQERIVRERSKYEGFDSLKEKAEQYDSVVERATAAETRASELERTVLKVRIATEFGVPENLLTGDSEETIRQTAQMLTEWRGGSAKTEAPGTRKVNQSGASKTPEVLSPKEKAAAALRQAL